VADAAENQGSLHPRDDAGAVLALYELDGRACHALAPNGR
jgi:hypothetical protein